MAFIPKDWRDASQDLTTPITAAALENMETRVTAGIPYENVLWHGAVGTDTGDQTAAIQAAIDSCEATGGTVYIPRGVYRMLGSLELHENISLIGDGPTASVLRWPTSLGADSWALTPDLTTGYARWGKIAGLYFDGPGSFGAPGSAVSDMNGVRISSGMRIEFCHITEFHRGLGVWNDHMEVHDCKITSNTYNAAWLTDQPGGGDIHFTSTDLNGATIASIYVESAQGIDGSFFLGCHLGTAPYGILSKAGKTGEGFLSASTFIESPTEAFGTAAIWGSNATDVINGCQWIRCGNLQDPVRLYPATTYEFLVRSGVISNCIFDMWHFTPTSAGTPGTAYFGATGSGAALWAVEFLHGGHQVLVDNDTRFLHRTPAAAPNFCSFSGPDARRGTFGYAGAAVTKGQLLKGWGFNCQTYDDDTLADAPFGVALQNGTAGEIIAVQTEGYSNLLVADGTIGANRFLKPAATNGRVVQASSWSDGPIVGVSMDPYTIGQAINAHIRLGTWG